MGWKENALLEAAASQRAKEYLVLVIFPSFTLLLGHYTDTCRPNPPQHSKLIGREHLRSTSGREDTEQINILSSKVSLTLDAITFLTPECSGFAHPSLHAGTCTGEL